MVSEISQCCELTLAMLTFIGFKILMNTHVNIKVSFFCEKFPAAIKGTLELWILVFMLIKFMKSQSIFPSEISPAEFARKFLLTRRCIILIFAFFSSFRILVRRHHLLSEIDHWLMMIIIFIYVPDLFYYYTN